jgi:DNA-directed RNA polymerase subunit F
LEWQHWRRDTAETEAALRVELMQNKRGIERSTLDINCTALRLDQLDAWADGRFALNAAHLEDPGNRPFIPRIQQTVWDAAKGGAAIAQLPLERRLIYARAYDGLENFRSNWLQREFTAWFNISRYAGKLARLDAEDARHLKEEVRYVRGMFLSRASYTKTFMKVMEKDTGLKIIDEDRHRSIDAEDVSALCNDPA